MSISQQQSGLALLYPRMEMHDEALLAVTRISTEHKPMIPTMLFYAVDGMRDYHQSDLIANKDARTQFLEMITRYKHVFFADLSVADSGKPTVDSATLFDARIVADIHPDSVAVLPHDLDAYEFGDIADRKLFESLGAVTIKDVTGMTTEQLFAPSDLRKPVHSAIPSEKK